MHDDHPPPGAFPRVRLRRNRSRPFLRRLVAEHRVAAGDLIWPVFVQEAPGRTAVPSLPGVDRLGPDVVADAVGRAAELGIPAIAVFAEVPAERKTAGCDEATNPDNLVCRTLRTLRRAFPELGLIGDVALDPYNSLGHDGLVRDGVVRNDETLAVLARQAVVQAEAGCDVLAPSDMMDGRVGVIRDALDAAGFTDRAILAYAAKYASACYGPFRDAIGSGAALGAADKRTYQMDPANADEALREVALDLQEGADIVMVKPGLPYLDVVHRIKRRFGVPTFAYMVSGEHAMLHAAAANGWLDRDAVLLELLTAFRRAGADAVLCYDAPAAAALLAGRS